MLRICLRFFAMMTLALTAGCLPEESATDTCSLDLLNLSSRGRVGAGEDVLIVGFTTGGNASKRVLIRAAGPSLATKGLTNALANPALRLTTSTGQVIASNDNWQDAPNAAEIQALGQMPENPLEAALVLNLDPNATYTAIVEGAEGATGVALLQVVEMP